METFISATDIEVSLKKHRDSLSYDDQFDIDIEFKITKLGEKGKTNFKKNDRYAVYLSKRYKRHKLNESQSSQT